MVIFVVGFLMCLIGSLLMGCYVDWYGCWVVFILFIIIMVSGFFIIVCIFSYGMIGLLFFIILVLVCLL